MNKKLKQKLKDIGWTLAISLLFAIAFLTVCYIGAAILSALLKLFTGA